MDERLQSTEQLPTVDEVTASLREYGEQHGLRGLEDRVMRGLDPAAMLALPATRQRLEQLAAAYGADMDAVEQLVKDLHVGGVWRHADELAHGSPAATVWTVAGEATVHGKAVLGDLTPEQFTDDMGRVVGHLDNALTDPGAFAVTARQNLIERASHEYVVDEQYGPVPVSTSPAGFLAMAVTGHKSGIVADHNNRLLFVGADTLDFEQTASRHGLTRTEQEDRGRQATFYIDDQDQRHIKQLYPGFGIVMNEDMPLAQDLASTAQPVD